MKISDAGIALIKNFEGFKSKAYRCPAGVITIGYGHTGKELTMKDQVTRARAEEILKTDLKWAEEVVNKRVKTPLRQNQFDALVSLVFNIGEPAFANSRLLTTLNAGNKDAVPSLIAQWNKITQNGKKVVSSGLVRRRQAEAELWLQSSDVLPAMPQKVETTREDKPIIKSRTVANASVAGVVGTTLAMSPVIEPAGKVIEIAENNINGFVVVIGLALMVFATIALYLRWDDKRKSI